MDARASSKGLRIVRHLEDVGDLWLDPDQVKQAVLNLLENAVDATDAGEIRVSCRAREEGWVELAVEDTGVGIAEGDREKIFDLYFTTKAEGTGLGLSMVYRIVSEHGGRIEVDSEVGRGTRFRIRLPGRAEDER
jgi:signal transduction histidine kinase